VEEDILGRPIEQVEYVAPLRCLPYRGRGRQEKLGCWRAEKKMDLEASTGWLSSFSILLFF
jgi:hypothetical protein